MRLLQVVWLDVVQHRKESLSVPYHPDLLLTNDFHSEEQRIFVELENSPISCPKLIGKLDRLCSMPADYYLFLCTSESIFLNLGRNIRRVLLGEAKANQKTLFFMPRSQSVLAKNLLIGIWKPSTRNNGEYHGLKDLAIFRYDDEIFDSSVWMKLLDSEHRSVKDVHGEVALRRHQIIPYPSRKPGKRKFLLGEILDRYSPGFRIALNKILKNPLIDTKPEPKQGASL